MKDFEKIFQNGDIYKYLFDNIPVVKLLIDPDGGKIIDANKKAVEYYGYNIEEIKALKISDINVLPDDEIKIEMERAEKEHRNYFMFKHKVKNGEIKKVEVYSHPVECLDGSKLLYSMVFDVDEKKAIMQSVVRALKRYETIFDLSSDGIYILFRKNKRSLEILEVNEAVIKRSKYTREELVGREITMLNPEVYKGVQMMISRKLDFGNDFRYQIDHFDKTGYAYPVEINGRYFNFSEEPFVIAIERDLTKQTRLAHELERHRYLYQQLFFNSPNAIFVLDRSANILDYNEACHEIFGYEEDEFYGKSLVELLSVNDEIKGEIKVNLNTILEGKTIRSVVKRQGKNGRILYLDVLSYPIRLEDGESGFFLIYSDITDNVERKEKIRLMSSIFENNTEGVMIADEKNRIIWVNEAFENITGYSFQECIGKRTSILKSGRHDAEFYKSMWQSIDSTGSWKGEIWNRKKSGEIYPQNLNIFIVENRSLGQIRYVALLSDLTTQKKQEIRINELIYNDSLTGLKNRKYFMEELEKRFKIDRTMGILFFDCDNFKIINDTMGHQFGDQVLIYFANLIKEIFKSDIVARMGGDEFVAIVDDMDRSSVESKLNRLRLELDRLITLSDRTIRLEVSMGIAMYPQDGIDRARILKHADIAMYQAKRERGTLWKWYGDIKKDNFDKGEAFNEALAKSLVNNEFEIVYQSIVEETGNIVGFEALLRWNSREFGLLEAKEFIPYLEESGRINDVGRWAVEKLRVDWSDFKSKYGDSCYISFNISDAELETESFVMWAENQIKNFGGNIYFEIKEKDYVISYSQIDACFENLEKVGIHLIIDDFGLGELPIRELVKSKVKYLKTDRRLLGDIEIYEDNETMIDMIFTISNIMGVDVIAKGIESLSQIEYLREKGCKYYQGYYFDKPKKKENYF